LARTRFDVVVSDIVMPGLKGTDLLKVVRRQKQGPEVILVTGEPTIETASQALRDGAFDYLAKPVNSRELRDTVSRAVKVKCLHDEKRLLAKENRRYQNHLEQLVELRTTELKKVLFGIVTAMSVTVEKRDPYTAGHQIRVAQLARAIAEKLRLPKDQVDGIYLARHSRISENKRSRPNPGDAEQ
jgi:response regulator RpfG family c-di-GMP phosphodiesterase